MVMVLNCMTVHIFWMPWDLMWAPLIGFLILVVCECRCTQMNAMASATPLLMSITRPCCSATCSSICNPKCQRYIKLSSLFPLSSLLACWTEVGLCILLPVAFTETNTCFHPAKLLWYFREEFLFISEMNLSTHSIWASNQIPYFKAGIFGFMYTMCMRLQIL